jgi:aminomethyltransferase
MSDVLKTALNQAHRRLGARMVDFAGWDMPVQYPTGIVLEHTAVRTGCGLFDLSHMGRVYIRGLDAIRLAQRCLTRDLSRLRFGQAAYGLLCNADGGILDDVIAYLLSGTELLFVFNASNRLKDVAWFESQRDAASLQAEIVDRTLETALIGLQGPKAQLLLQPHCPTDLEAMAGYTVISTTVLGRRAIVARTGYTGEDGFELYLEAADAEPVWDLFADEGVVACGLGARDTLRTEAGMALYGHELDESTNPYEAGLAWTVSLTKESFTGREALARIKAEEPARKLVGFLVEEGGVPRPGFPLMIADRQVGQLTSGTFSPTLKRSIALGYVISAAAELGTRADVEIRGRRVAATVVSLPFVPHHTRPRTLSS